MLDGAVARRQHDRIGTAVRDADRVPARPLLRLGLEDDVIRTGPLDRGDAGEVFVVFLCVPDLLAFAARDVGHPERHRVAATEGRTVESRPLVVARISLALAAAAAAARLP